MDSGTKKQAVKLLAAMCVTYAVSAVGAIASVSAQSYYAELEQPSWAPPAGIFGPVWTTLYTMMGLATWLIWRRAKTSDVSKELMIYGAQLVANGLWSWLFFKWQMGAAAFVDILILLVLISLNVVVYWRSSKWAGLLLVPYLAWVCFAAFLCYTVWQLNPQELG